jgi:hypothetical protein
LDSLYKENENSWALIDKLKMRRNRRRRFLIIKSIFSA